MTSPLAASLDVSAIPARPAGAGRYVVELVRALGGRDDLALTVVTRGGDAARWAELAPAGRVLDPVWAPRPLRVAYEQWRLGPFVRHLSDPPVAVHHGPHYTLPHGLSGLGSVVTIHDLTFFDHPEWHERSKVPFFRRAIRRAAEHADVVICVSDRTAERLGQLLSPRAQVFVAPHGVDHRRFNPGPDSGDGARVQRAGCPDDLEYVLHLGTAEPRKGIVPLVQAFDRIAAAHPKLGLVLGGLEGWGSEAVGRAIAASAHGSRIRRLGYVEDDAVPALLRSAKVVAYPSFEEGFGIPALEALACGAPLVTTSGTAMADVAAGAAFTAPPGDVGALAGALEGALTAGAAELGRRRSKGLEQAAAFTWERTAATHALAYAAAAGGGPGRAAGRR